MWTGLVGCVALKIVVVNASNTRYWYGRQSDLLISSPPARAATNERTPTRSAALRASGSRSRSNKEISEQQLLSIEMGKGKLTFKGDAKKQKKKKRSKSKHSITIGGQKSSNEGLDNAATDTLGQSIHASVDETVPSTSSSTESKPIPAAASMTPRIEKGKGKVTSSASVLTGYETQFSNLRAGDAILVQLLPIPGSETKQEMRVITMILSNTSASISTPFSQDLKSPTQYSFISKPRNYEEEARVRLKKQKELTEETERCAFGTYKSTVGNKELVYREKTVNGGYRIRKETLHDDVTRGDLLNLRAKKKSDRYC